MLDEVERGRAWSGVSATGGRARSGRPVELRGGGACYRALTAAQIASRRGARRREHGVTLGRSWSAAAPPCGGSRGRVPDGDIVVARRQGQQRRRRLGGRARCARRAASRVISLARPDDSPGIAARGRRGRGRRGCGVGALAGAPPTRDLLSTRRSSSTPCSASASRAAARRRSRRIDARQRAGALVLAVDVPTGVDADTGAVGGRRSRPTSR